MLEAPTTNDKLIWDVWLAYLPGAAMASAIELGMIEALGDRPDTAPGLAERLGLNRRGTIAVLRLLTAVGLLESRGGVYRLSDTARIYLRESSDFSFLGILRPGQHSSAGSAHLQISAALRKVAEDTPFHASQTGLPIDNWSSGQIDIDTARRVAAFMHSHSQGPAIGVARNVDFTGVTRFLDVGGGSGCFAIAVAERHPQIGCAVMELPAMCETAGDYIRKAGVEGRVDTLAVDMFRMDWPQGYDALFFSNIFHDWGFETCAFLAARAFAALPSGGRIMLHEMLLDDDGNGPAVAAAFSLMMLFGTQGQQFTFGELKSILEGAGFTDIAAVNSYSYYSVVSGVKP